jgi:hypothetical protein
VTMANSSLSKLRRELKSRLYRERTVWTKSGYTPVCAICGEPSTDGALQMHETFITRGDVSGNNELVERIMSRYNCVLVDAVCHEDANSDEGVRACAKNILEYESQESVLYWLSMMAVHMKTTTPLQAIQLVKEVYNEMQGMR